MTTTQPSTPQAEAAPRTRRALGDLVQEIDGSAQDDHQHAEEQQLPEQQLEGLGLVQELGLLGGDDQHPPHGGDEADDEKLLRGQDVLPQGDADGAQDLDEHHDQQHVVQQAECAGSQIDPQRSKPLDRGRDEQGGGRHDHGDDPTETDTGRVHGRLPRAPAALRPPSPSRSHESRDTAPDCASRCAHPDPAPP